MANIAQLVILKIVSGSKSILFVWHQATLRPSVDSFDFCRSSFVGANKSDHTRRRLKWLDFPLFCIEVIKSPTNLGRWEDTHSVRDCATGCLWAPRGRPKMAKRLVFLMNANDGSSSHAYLSRQSIPSESTVSVRVQVGTSSGPKRDYIGLFGLIVRCCWRRRRVNILTLFSLWLLLSSFTSDGWHCFQQRAAVLFQLEELNGLRANSDEHDKVCRVQSWSPEVAILENIRCGLANWKGPSPSGVPFNLSGVLCLKGALLFPNFSDLWRIQQPRRIWFFH